MSDTSKQSSLISPDDEIYTYLAPNGQIKTIDVRTGKEIKDKTLTLESYLKTQKWVYSEVLAQIICQKIIEGGKISHICKEKGFPPLSVVTAWRKKYPEFNDLLGAAEKAKADVMMDHVQTIAENAMAGEYDKESVPGARLAADKFEKVSESANPAKYGKMKDQQVRKEYFIMIDTGIHSPVIKEVQSIDAKETADGIRKEGVDLIKDGVKDVL